LNDGPCFTICLLNSHFFGPYVSKSVGKEDAAESVDVNMFLDLPANVMKQTANDFDDYTIGHLHRMFKNGKQVLDEIIEQRVQTRIIAEHNHFMCPITHELINDPVVAEDGHTYERQAIITWVQNKETSPKTNLSMPSGINMMISNHFAKTSIEEARLVQLRNFSGEDRVRRSGAAGVPNYLSGSSPGRLERRVLSEEGGKCCSSRPFRGYSQVVRDIGVHLYSVQKPLISTCIHTACAL